MKTQELFKFNRHARRLNESMHKVFGTKINLENFNLHQLQDARNKLRTQVSQVRASSEFNENLNNESFHQAQFMLDTLNAEIAEREEYVIDNFIPESKHSNKIDGKTASSILDKLKNGRNCRALCKTNPALQHKYDVIAQKQGLDPKHDADDIEDALRSYLEDVAGKYKNKEDIMTRESRNNQYRSNSRSGMRQTNESRLYRPGVLREGEIQQASAIVTAKTMVDRVSRWIEELSGMENDTLLDLGDSIRDEMSQELAKQFVGTVAPAIQNALLNLKKTRETLATGVRTLTGEEQSAEMIGASPGGEAPPMGGEEGEEMGGEEGPPPMGGEEGPPPVGDEFGAADAAAGGAESAGREQRESINFQNRLLKVLAG